MNQTYVREGENRSSVSTTNPLVRAFRNTFLVTLVLLVIQYLLGIIANLYPGTMPTGNAWGWVFGNSPLVVLHIINGTLLIVVALVALILSIIARHTAGIITAVVGLALLIFAWLSGAQFLAQTDQNGLSLRMALGFIGALIAYALGYYLARPRSEKQSN